MQSKVQRPLSHFEILQRIRDTHDLIVHPRCVHVGFQVTKARRNFLEDSEFVFPYEQRHEGLLDEQV